MEVGENETVSKFLLYFPLRSVYLSDAFDLVRDGIANFVCVQIHGHLVLQETKERGVIVGRNVLSCDEGGEGTLYLLDLVIW